MRERFADRREMSRRTADVDGPSHKARHWLSVAISRNPVLAGMVVATLIATVALAMVVEQQGRIRAQSHQIAMLVVSTQEQRIGVTREFCQKINGNAEQANRATDTLNAIIIGSVRQSRAFEPTYRKLGLPPYKVRLRQATSLTRRLEKQKIPVLDCARYVQRIRASLGRVTGPDHLLNYPH